VGEPPPGCRRPRRADVVAAYDLGAAAYQSLWSPVILAPAEVLVAALGLDDARRLLDVGAGTGAVAPALRRAAPMATVVALDASTEMLRAAPANARTVAVRADAQLLPIRTGTMDAVLLAFVLFHLAEPALGMNEAAGVLRPGGRVGTVTWAREVASRADDVWQETLAEFEVRPPPPRRVDAGLGHPSEIEALFVGAGLQPRTMWIERLTYQWDRKTFWRLVTGSGVNRLRLHQLDETSGEAVLERAWTRLGELEPTDFAWWGEVLCGIAPRT
jgi:ubiquinone/menaquinone biosynthesis C-methylase UbiE